MAKIASLYPGVLFLDEVPSLSINPIEVAKNASNVLHSNLINNSKAFTCDEKVSLSPFNDVYSCRVCY